MTGKAVTLTGYGKPAPPSSHSPWKTLPGFPQTHSLDDEHFGLDFL